MSPNSTNQNNSNIGRQASEPSEIPWPGWKQILLRTKDEISKDNIPVMAAGLAFYAMLALFPLLIALISIYGLMFDPQDLQAQLESTSTFLPEEVRTILFSQFEGIVSASSSKLGWGVALSIFGALWTASSGTQSLIGAYNTVYDEKEKRGFIKLRALALLFTVGFIIFIIIAVGLIAVLPSVLSMLGLGPMTETIIAIVRWPFLGLAVVGGLAFLNRFAPSRERPQWTWISWGAVATTLLWLGVSGLFSYYASNFASYNETYGSLGSVIVLLMWLYLSALAILLGAELNSEIEHQTAVDTTTGAPNPIGQRGAQKADHLPNSGSNNTK